MNRNRFRTTHLERRRIQDFSFFFLACKSLQWRRSVTHPTSLKHSFCFSHQTALRFTSNNSARTKETTHTHTACARKHTRVIQYTETTHHSVDSAIWSQPTHKQPVNTFLQSIIKFLFLSFTYKKKEKKKKKNPNPAHDADAAKISVLFKRFLLDCNVLFCIFKSWLGSLFGPVFPVQFINDLHSKNKSPGTMS